MQQRTALEQDVADFANSVNEILKGQLELQRLISELIQQLLHDNCNEDSQYFRGLNQSSFGVNMNAICLNNDKDEPLSANNGYKISARFFDGPGCG